MLYVYGIIGVLIIATSLLSYQLGRKKQIDIQAEEKIRQQQKMLEVNCYANSVINNDDEFARLQDKYKR